MKLHVLLGLSVAATLAACAPTATGPARVATMTPVLQAGAAIPAGGGPRGRAELISLSNNMTRVSVTLQGLAPNSRHAGHIHMASCAQGGGVVLPLPDITAGADGNGSTMAEVETAKIPAAAYVQYHERATGDASGIGAGITCGDVR